MYSLLRQRKSPDSDIEWQDIADYMSEQTGVPVAREYCRKGAPLFYLFDEANWVRPPSDDGGAGYAAMRLEAEKAAVKARDERNELARIQREMARRDSMIELVKEGIRYEISPVIGYEPHDVVPSDCDVVAHLTDLHCGIKIDNCFNRYNENVLAERLGAYLNKIDDIRQQHGAENCYVLLGGDLCSGLIHATLRLENNLDIIKQVKVVSSLIAQFLQHLSGMFGRVEVYSVPGNHSRIQPKKEDNLKGENFDVLIPFIVGLMLKEYENVHIHEENAEESVAMFSVRGQKVFGVHGDKDSMENVVQKLTMVWGVKPDIVLAGHRHTNGMRTVYDSKVIESGSLSGPDAYCMDKRLRNKPEQMVLVVSDSGLDCLYDVALG